MKGKLLAVPSAESSYMISGTQLFLLLDILNLLMNYMSIVKLLYA